MPIDVLKVHGVVLFSNASGVHLGDARLDPCSGTATHGCLRSSDGPGSKCQETGGKHSAAITGVADLPPVIIGLTQLSVLSQDKGPGEFRFDRTG
jgi:hypothetical protein